MQIFGTLGIKTPSFRRLSNLCHLQYTKSLFRSRAGSNFYGTEIETWAVSVPVGNTEKKIGSIMGSFSGRTFHVFMGK